MSRQTRRGEIKELQDQLANPQLAMKKVAVRKIIDAMTRGKDVSMLFMDIVKNMENTDMELKKLIYLYIINYAKSHPDLAILAINSFRKDAMDKQNPFLRALAVRTMGCIRVKQITEYLMDTLRKAMKDEDSYVRKTAALTVAKLYDVSPDIIQDQGLLVLLTDMLEDGNAMVVSNAVAALQAIGEARGAPAFKVTQQAVQKFLTALNECTEWGQIYLMDQISLYTPVDSSEAESVLDRIVPRIQHQNSGVLLAAVRLVLKYLDFLSDVELTRQYSRKLTSPLISLMNQENEVVYVALKNMQVICQKRPLVLEKEVKPFFCKFNDPIYVKLEKLELLVLLCNNDNYQQILNEFKEYINEVDVEFVRKAIRGVGRIGVKNEKAADRAVAVLQECLRNRVNYQVQEVIVVIKDVFRRYPFKYEALLPELCENLKSLDDPEAKSSMIYIIGDYIESIENADQLLEIFLDSFPEDNYQVQMQTLVSVMKLLLIRPDEGQPLFMNLLQFVQNESENPDLRERLIFYQRLLQSFPEKARAVVIQEEKPELNHTTFGLEQNLLDKLADNLGSLASVYHKQPESFVKRLRDIQNQLKEMQDNDIQADGDPEELLQHDQQYDYGKQEQEQKQPVVGAQKETNLLDDDLLGNDDVQPVQSAVQAQSFPNVQIPSTNVFGAQQSSMNGNISGLTIEAAVQKQGKDIVLQMSLDNQSGHALSEFAIKINNNPFRLQPKNQVLSLSALENGRQAQVEVSLDCDGPADNNAPAFPLKVQVALRTQMDVVVFSVPVSLSCLLQSSCEGVTQQQYMAYQQQFQHKKVEQVSVRDPAMVTNPLLAHQRLLDNGLHHVGTRTNPSGQSMNSYIAKTVNNMPLLADAIFHNGVMQFQLVVPHPSLLQLFYQALGFILTL